MSQVSDLNVDAKRVDLKSLDVAEEKRQELLRLFPEVRTEGGKIDFDRLKLTLGETVEADKVNCGKRHFETIGVPFSVVVTTQQV